MNKVPLVILFTLTLSSLGYSQRRNRSTYPPKMEDAKVETYKTVGDAELNFYIFSPDDHQATDKAAAIVFFFGGGWRSGSPVQFQQHCQYLASRGMVAITADYRVLSRHGTPAVKCVADGKSAIRYIRENAERLGIDPERIAAGGGSAGGHVAACTGTISGFDEAGENLDISAVPNAMALFNPATVLAPVESHDLSIESRMEELRERMGVEPRELSPLHHVSPGDPPSIIFHGTADSTVSFETAKLFAEAMREAGNRCELVAFEGRGHGFFNYGRNENRDFVQTIRKLDEFLRDLGFLEGEPTID